MDSDLAIIREDGSEPKKSIPSSIKCPSFTNRFVKIRILNCYLPKKYTFLQEKNVYLKYAIYKNAMYVNSILKFD